MSTENKEEDNTMKNIFINKPGSLEEVKNELKRIAANEYEQQPEAYKVIAHKTVTEENWNSLTHGFMEDRDWLAAFSARLANRKNVDWTKRNCIRVTCEGKQEVLLIDTQGYNYARYVAIED